MIDITKTAYSSSFSYPEIIYNNSHTIASGQTLTINHGYTKGAPYVKVWGELFTGEYSALFAISAQYSFALDYDNAGIWGYDITVSSTQIIVTNNCTSSKTVYIRAYSRE